MSELSPLQVQAAKLLGRGYTPTDVKKHLELPQTLFAQWREDDDFNAAVEREKFNETGAIEGETLLEAASAFGMLDPGAPIITKDPSEPSHYDPAAEVK